MLTVGDQLPAFDLTACIDNGNPSSAFAQITQDSNPGKWLVLFAWPKDFTFICPTEIKAFSDMAAEFTDRDAQILGLSTDSEFVHHAWRTHHEDLKDLQFPMLSDIKREFSEALGILHRDEGVCLRATFIVDPQGVVRHVSVNDLFVGRSPSETLRVLDALQTDELCPCNWEPGQETLEVA